MEVVREEVSYLLFVGGFLFKFRYIGKLFAKLVIFFVNAWKYKQSFHQPINLTETYRNL